MYISNNNNSLKAYVLVKSFSIYVFTSYFGICVSINGKLPSLISRERENNEVTK